MKALIAITIALALPAAADHVKPYKDASLILVPPPEFDNRLRKYNTTVGKFTRFWGTHQQVIDACGIGPVMGCAKRSNWSAKHRQFNTCRVFMPNNLPLETRAAVNRHEVGHCLGWSHAGQTGTVAGLFEMEDGSLVWIEIEGLPEDDHLHHGGEE